MKNENIHIRIHPDLKKKIQEKAEKEYKTLTAYILDLIRKDLNKQVFFLRNKAGSYDFCINRKG